jgi:hypothetical protein
VTPGRAVRWRHVYTWRMIRTLGHSLVPLLLIGFAVSCGGTDVSTVSGSDAATREPTMDASVVRRDARSDGSRADDAQNQAHDSSPDGERGKDGAVNRPDASMTQDGAASANEASVDGDGASPAGDAAMGVGLGGACVTGMDCETSNCEGNICCASSCAASAPQSCGLTGSCASDGSGCAHWPTATTCGAAAACTDGISGSWQTTASACDGAGACVAGVLSSCGAFKCSGDACGTSCATDNDCVSSGVCGTASVCVVKLGPGKACTGDDACSSGNCLAVAGGAGSVCCATACIDQGAASCGTNGDCSADGVDCAFYPTTTPCSAGSCQTDPYGVPAISYATPPSLCSGQGNCLLASPRSVSCGDYGCGGATPLGTSCATSCTDSSDCLEGDICTGNACVNCSTLFAAGTISTFTAPTTGAYTITASGGSGGANAAFFASGGGAAGEQATFTLTGGTVLQVVAGAQSASLNGNIGAGGGGGSFVWIGSTGSPLPSTPLLVAGGGGGAFNASGRNAVTDGSAGSGAPGAGGGICSILGAGGGGAGWLGAGGTGGCGGAQGGQQWGGGSGDAVGGFGGGGGGDEGAGGGGGYSGGSGGNANGTLNGGGGTSYVNASGGAVSAISGLSGDGHVWISSCPGTNIHF